MGPDFVTDTIVEWFNTLDYEYMLLHVMLCYGLYYSNNMQWIVKKFGSRVNAVWWVGGIIGALESIRFLPWFRVDEIGIDVQQIVSIFHSYLLIQVFVDDIVQTVHSWFVLLKKTKNIGSDSDT